MKCKIYLIASLALINYFGITIQALPYPGSAIVNQYNRSVTQTPTQEVRYESYYIHPTRFLTGQEKAGSRSGKSEIPMLAIKRTEHINVPMGKYSRPSKKIWFDIQETINQLQKKTIGMPIDPEAKIEFNIKQQFDNNNNPEFVMQLPKYYLAGGALNPFTQQWGPWWKDIKDMGDYWEFVLRYNEILPTPVLPQAG